MARVLNGTSDYLGTLFGTPLSASAGPFTVNGWIKPQNLTDLNRWLFATASSTANSWGLRWGGAGAAKLDFWAAGYTGTNPSTSSALTLSSAHAASGVFFAYRYVGAGGAFDKFLAGSKTSISAAITFALPTLTSSIYVGTDSDGDAGEFYGGAVAEIAIWSAALSDAEILELHQGAAADQFARSALVFYAPLRGNSSPEPDYSSSSFPGTTALTVGGATIGAHPPIYGRPVKAVHDAAWVLELRHSAGTLRVASTDLSSLYDVDVLGAPYPKAIANAASISIEESGSGGVLIPSASDVQVDMLQIPAYPAVVAPGLYNAARTSLNPKMYLRLDEVSGGTAADVMGTHPGTYNGPSLAKVGPILRDPLSRAAYFDGVNDEVTVADHANLDLTSSFSIKLWVKIDSLAQTNRYLLNKNNSYAVLYGYVSQTVEFYSGAYSGTDPRPGTQMKIGDTARWHLVEYDYDGTTWTGRLDGEVQFSVTRTFSLTTNGSQLTVGSAGGAAFAQAYLAEVAIWKGVTLGDERVRQMYNCGVGKYSGLRNYEWRGVPFVLSRYSSLAHELAPEMQGVIGLAPARGNLINFQLRSYLAPLFQTKIPRRTITPDECPSANDLNAPIPVVAGTAMVACPNIGNIENEDATGGSDFLASVIKDYADADMDVRVEKAYWDTSDEPGFELATGWHSPKAPTYVSTTSFKHAADDTRTIVDVGAQVRAVTTASAGQWVYSHIPSGGISFAAGDTTITIAHAILDSGINTGGCIDTINPTPTAAGSGYVAGELLNVTTGGSNGKARVVRVNGSGGVLELRLVQPGSGYTTGTGKATSGSAGGSACTVEITAIAPGVQLSSEFFVERGRYELATRDLLSLRFRLDGNNGGVVAQVANSSLTNAANFIREIIANGLWGLAKSVNAGSVTTAAAVLSSASLASAVDGGLGLRRAQVRAGDAIASLLALRGGALQYDAVADEFQVYFDSLANAAAATFGYGDSFYNNIASPPAWSETPLEQMVGTLRLRYGSQGRTASNANGPNWSQADYLYSIKATVHTAGVGEEVLTSEWLSKFAEAAIVLCYVARRRRYEDERVSFVAGQEARRLRLWDRDGKRTIVRVKDPLNGKDRDMALSRIVRRLDRIEISCVGYDPAIYTYDAAEIGFDDGVGKFTQGNAATRNERRIAPGYGANLVSNPDFLAPIRNAVLVASSLPGFSIGGLANVSALSVAANVSAVGGAVLTITTSASGVSLAAKSSLSSSGLDSTMRVQPGLNYAASIYSDSPIGWNFVVFFLSSAGATLQTSNSPLQVDPSEKTATGFQRYYMTARAPAGAAYAQVQISLNKAATFKFDAIKFEVLGLRAIRPSDWTRNPSPTIDPAAVAGGAFQIRPTGGQNEHGTEHAIKTWTMNLSGSLVTSATSATEGIEAGMILDTVTARVVTAITGSPLGWSLGVPANTDRFGSLLANTLGTTCDGILNGGGSFQAGAAYAAAVGVRITSNGGDFTGGVVRVSLHYRKATPPQA